MMNKSELTKLFAEYAFHPLKRFGENYLIDKNIKDKIIGEAAVSGKDTILEIGPGLGALTIDLAASGARVIGVEKDRKAFGILEDIAGKRFANLELHNCDILKFDIGSLAASDMKVVGNLPYYITTPIIEYLIAHRSFIKTILVVMQKEVAGRLLAGPGDDNYGSISCFLQYYTEPRYIYTIKRTSFYPVPEVDSALIKLDIRDAPPVKVRSEEAFFRVVRGAFNQRRKSIINSLSRKDVLDVPKSRLVCILSAAGIDPASRAEELSMDDFASIANATEG